MILVVWKLVPESRCVVSFHSFQKFFSVDVGTARTFVGLRKTEYRPKFKSWNRIWERKEFAYLHEWQGTLNTEITRCPGWEELIGWSLSDWFLELAGMQMKIIFYWDFWNIFNPKVLINFVSLTESIWQHHAGFSDFFFFKIHGTLLCNK